MLIGKKLPSLVYIIGKLKWFDLLRGFNSKKFPSANIDFLSQVIVLHSR